jgi:hypothetical protein
MIYLITTVVIVGLAVMLVYIDKATAYCVKRGWL